MAALIYNLVLEVIMLLPFMKLVCFNIKTIFPGMGISCGTFLYSDCAELDPCDVEFMIQMLINHWL